MAEVVVFHHEQGLTPGVLALAERLRAAGHTVHTPDLFGGRTFDDLADGLEYAEGLGFDVLVERAWDAVGALPHDVVLVGMSLGVLPAQAVAQSMDGVRAAVLLHGCIPAEEFERPWPAGLPAQVHVMADDELGDVEAARELAAQAPDVTLFTYPGDAHLFTDASLPEHDPEATAVVVERVLALLAGITQP